MKDYVLEIVLLGHGGFGATNTMIDLAEDMSEDEQQRKLDWWGKDEGKPLGDYRDISRVVVDEILFTATEESVRLMGMALGKMMEAANAWGDEQVVGGVTYNIREWVEDENQNTE